MVIAIWLLNLTFLTEDGCLERWLKPEKLNVFSTLSFLSFLFLYFPFFLIVECLPFPGLQDSKISPAAILSCLNWILLNCDQWLKPGAFNNHVSKSSTNYFQVKKRTCRKQVGYDPRCLPGLNIRGGYCYQPVHKGVPTENQLKDWLLVLYL